MILEVVDYINGRDSLYGASFLPRPRMTFGCNLRVIEMNLFLALLMT